MSHFNRWFENVVSSSRLIADSDALSRVWIKGEKGITSMFSVDELLEQLLGDLHIEENVPLFENDLKSCGAFEAFQAFAKELAALEVAVGSDPQLGNPENLLSSQRWEAVRLAAERIRELPSQPLTRDG